MRDIYSAILPNSSYIHLKEVKYIFENKGSHSTASEEIMKMGVDNLYLFHGQKSNKVKSLLLESFRTFRICDMKNLEFNSSQ